MNKNKLIIHQMDKALKKHLRKIVDMYIGDEQRHFMEAPCKNHIYASLKKVDEFLVGGKKKIEPKKQ